MGRASLQDSRIPQGEAGASGQAGIEFVPHTLRPSYPPAACARRAAFDLVPPPRLRSGWQNNYSLLVRVDTELNTMAETCSKQQADVGFLAYSPLAGG